MENTDIQQLSKSREFQNFLEFLAEKANELNNLSDLPDGNPEEVALEAKARQRAFKKLREIVLPFVDVKERAPVVKNSSYVV